ncbi:hypothetical protein ACXR0O_08270 [Verrucomicrobiota bacterium sgz303538]
MKSKTEIFKPAVPIVALSAALCFSTFTEDDSEGSGIVREDKTGAKDND